MSNRTYRLLLGIVLLVSLYFDLYAVMIGVVLVELLEGLTNWRIPILVNRLFGLAPVDEPGMPGTTGHKVRLAFDGERAWRLAVAAALTLSFLVFDDELWWFAWFMGFAIFGAGLSGVCPMLISLKLIGFR